MKSQAVETKTPPPTKHGIVELNPGVTERPSWGSKLGRPPTVGGRRPTINPERPTSTPLHSLGTIAPTPEHVLPGRVEFWSARDHFGRLALPFPALPAPAPAPAPALPLPCPALGPSPVPCPMLLPCCCGFCVAGRNLA